MYLHKHKLTQFSFSILINYNIVHISCSYSSDNHNQRIDVKPLQDMLLAEPELSRLGR